MAGRIGVAKRGKLFQRVDHSLVNTENNESNQAYLAHYNSNSSDPQDLVMIVNHLNHFSAIVTKSDLHYTNEFPMLPSPKG